ncbi:MAG: hypothetical protein NTZ27_04070 [Ignavibacteriales bacterium]|nr:hypothetical protein [Ignavibacteriales bacterium]
MNCYKCKNEIKSNQKYAAILDSHKLYQNTEDARKNFEIDVYDKALQITQYLCANCINESIDNPFIKVDGWRLPLPSYSLGIHAQSNAVMGYANKNREANGKEVCIICSRRSSNYKITAFYNNYGVLDWMWLCDYCINDWCNHPKRLLFSRKKIFTWSSFF